MKEQKRYIKALYDSFSFFAKNLEARIDFLAGVFGSLGNQNDEESLDDYY